MSQRIGPIPSSAEYLDNMYYFLGDPAMQICLGGTLQTPNVFYPHEVPPGQLNMRITVTVGGRPVENALVCLWKRTPSGRDEFYKTGAIDEQGVVTLTINPATAGEFSVVVRNGHASTLQHTPILPFEGTATVAGYSAVPKTYPTQVRHLVRRPGTTEIHTVYQLNSEGLYRQSTDGGITWLPAEYVADGSTPCVSLDCTGAPWITYNAGLHDTTCAVKRSNSEWHSVLIWNAPAVLPRPVAGPVSMVCSNTLGPGWQDDTG